MIVSWQHKGLKAFYYTGKKSGIIPQHAHRIKVILQLLDVANHPDELNQPGLDFHQLKGNLKGLYSVAVRANWKIIFKFKGQDVILVNYLDYH